MTQPDLFARCAYDGVYHGATNLLATLPNVSTLAWLTASSISPLLLHEQPSAIRFWLSTDGARLSIWVNQWFHSAKAAYAITDEAWLLDRCAIDIQAALDQRDLDVDDLAPLLARAQAFPAAIAGLHADLVAQVALLDRLTQNLAEITFRSTQVRDSMLETLLQQGALLVTKLGHTDAALQLGSLQATLNTAQALRTQSTTPATIHTEPSGDQAIINLAPNQGIQGVFYGPVTMPYTPAPSRPAVRHLRAPVGDFIGRTREIEQIYQVLCRAAEADTTTALVGIFGLGGIGKTELAYAVAQRLRPLFPDGQIVLRLGGASENPLSTTHALQQIIHAFLPDEKLSDDLDELSGRYCSVLAGKHVLIFADNALNAVQMRPLLPPPGCALLITSRNRFVLPGMQLLTLKTLDPDQANALLLTICRRIQDAAPKIAELCGYLPLALRVSASLLARRDHQPILEYVDQLRVARERLAALRDPEDPALDVIAALQLSYDQLSADAQSALRWLSVFAANFAPTAAHAVLAPIAAPAARALIDTLCTQSLLEYDQSQDRFSLHDLVRVFADGYLETTERTDAEQRYLSHYLDIVEQASPHLIGPDQGVWLQRIEQDHEHILAALNLSATQPDASRLLRLTGAMWRFWEGRGYLQEGQTWLDKALEQSRADLPAAPAFKDVYAETLTGAGALAQTLGRYDVARQHFAESLAVWEQAGNRLGCARAQNNLGHALMHQGEYAAAECCFSESLALRYELGDRWGAAVVQCNMGVLSQDQGDHARAIQLLEQGIAELSALEDSGSVAMYRDNLGHSFRALGDLAGARALFEDSLAHRRTSGDRWGIASALESLGLVALAEGDLQQASEHLRACLDLYEELDDTEGLIWAIEGIAHLAGSSGAAEPAALLLGATSAARQQDDLPLPPSDMARYDQFIQMLQAQLGISAYAAASACGGLLTLKQATIVAHKSIEESSAGDR